MATRPFSSVCAGGRGPAPAATQPSISGRAGGYDPALDCTGVAGIMYKRGGEEESGEVGNTDEAGNIAAFAPMRRRLGGCLTRCPWADGPAASSPLVLVSFRSRATVRSQTNGSDHDCRDRSIRATAEDLVPVWPCG
jgi:hypothetical protein